MKNSHYTLDDGSGGGSGRGLENIYNTEIFSIIVMKQIINFLQIKKKNNTKKNNANSK